MYQAECRYSGRPSAHSLQNVSAVQLAVSQLNVVLLLYAGHHITFSPSICDQCKLEEFKYLGATLTSKNPIQEEIKSRLKVGNVCYYSVQNLLSSSLLSRKLKIDI